VPCCSQPDLMDCKAGQDRVEERGRHLQAGVGGDRGCTRTEPHRRPEAQRHKTRRATRRATDTSRPLSTMTGMPRLGTGGIRQGGAVAFPGRVRARAEKLHRGRHGRRSEVDRRATPASLPQCKMGHGPLPCSRMDKRCARPGKTRRMAGSAHGHPPGRQAGEGRKGPGRAASRRRPFASRGAAMRSRRTPKDLSAQQREQLLELKRSEGHLARAWTLKEDLEGYLPRKGCA